MTTVSDIEWESCLLQPAHNPELEHFVRKTLGVTPPVTKYFLLSPWIVRSMVTWDVGQLGLRHVNLELARLVGLVVSQDNSCRYCYAASRALLKIVGYSEGRIRQLEQDLLTTELSTPIKEALEYTRRVSRASPLPSRGDAKRLREIGHSDEMIKELTFLAAVHVYYNRLATLPAVPTDTMERLDQGWMLRLLRPVLAWMMRSKTRDPGPLSPELRSGPYGYLVDAFAGLPIATCIGQAMHEAWQSPVLPRRAKALVFAVIARALGCSLSEHEAVRLLAEQGLAPAVIGDILAHLASPTLDAAEAVIVPFARETIWYRPVQIQRRARAVSSHLSPEQFVELTGIAALANAVCRMSVVLAPQ